MDKEEQLFEHQYIAFFTATILEWKKLLKPDKYKKIITNSLSFLVKNNRVKVHAFVIMPNHIHLLWRILPPHKKEDVQRDFLKFTAQCIKVDLKEYHPQVLEMFKVNAKDRKYQFWERNPMSLYCFSEKILHQKLEYIHQNPLQEKWKLAERPEDYEYSSAKFYLQNMNDFDFLSHYAEG